MLDEVQTAARPYYEETLPYHNWEHVQDTIDAAEELLARCGQYDVDVDDDVVQYALYFHDANYRDGFHDHAAMGYDSMEAYSAAIAVDELKKLGVTPDTIEQVQNSILATRHEAKIGPDDPNEWKVVRAADLRGLMADYDTFKENALALWDEHERLTTETLTADQWADNVEHVLEHYLAQDIRLTPEHDTDGGTSEFHAHTRRNLYRFRKEFGN